MDETCVGYQGLVDILSFSGESLESLSLRKCGLENLPNLIIWGNAKMIKHLDLADNFLKNIPEVVFQALENLETLVLSGNRFGH